MTTFRLSFESDLAASPEELWSWATSSFLEQSLMLSMKCWRHERIIAPSATGGRLTDKLEFAPRLAAPLLALLVKVLFRPWHRVLRRQLGQCV